VWSENTSTVLITESQIATPPSIAVGFLCQRSVFGCATKPKRRASARTKKVRISAKQKDIATARIVRGLNGIGVKQNYATKRHKKHKMKRQEQVRQEHGLARALPNSGGKPLFLTCSFLCSFYSFLFFLLHFVPFVPFCG
jgi:hypothetical protein